jgi:hypothetical protein
LGNKKKSWQFTLLCHSFYILKKHDNLCGIAKVLGNLSNDMILHCFATADKGKFCEEFFCHLGLWTGLNGNIIGYPEPTNIHAHNQKYKIESHFLIFELLWYSQKKSTTKVNVKYPHNLS